MESFIYNVFSNNSPNVDLIAEVLHEPQGRPDHVSSAATRWVVPKGSKNTADACTYMKAVTSVNAWLAAAKKRLDAPQGVADSTFTGLYTANAVADKKIYKDIYQSFGHPQFDKAVQILVHASKYGFELPPTPAGSSSCTRTPTRSTASSPASSRSGGAGPGPEGSADGDQREQVSDA